MAAEAATIRVLNQGVSGHVGVVAAVNHLTSLGHSVSTGNVLTDYSAYDQVWDLRYNINFTLDDLNAFTSYLGGGGRIYVTGENPSFDAQRNTSLRGLLFALGAGDVSYGGGVPSNTQTFTTAGAALNSPNNLAAVGYLGARQVTGGGSGFLVTESPAATGSMVAWDFGQIDGAASARMIAVWDIDLFRPEANGVALVENLAYYLGAAPPSAVPEPATLASFAFAVVLIAACRRKQRLL
ncbi:MAG: PEP-CTERM sorting domain-containing protein [Bryobacterales bacterium]|nr:PEP-CTERM sorting domain-containing protein [Bryobacterales bacterium]